MNEILLPKISWLQLLFSHQWLLTPNSIIQGSLHRLFLVRRLLNPMWIISSYPCSRWSTLFILSWVSPSAKNYHFRFSCLLGNRLLSQLWEAIIEFPFPHIAMNQCRWSTQSWGGDLWILGLCCRVLLLLSTEMVMIGLMKVLVIVSETKY